MKVTNEQLEESLEYIKNINSLLNNHTETTGPTAFNMASDLLESRAQNAELLAALKEIRDSDDSERAMQRIARAAIAKMEEGK